MGESSSASPGEVRSSNRANVFLAAVLRAPCGALPVRIRNLSASGALVDGTDLPGQGHVVRLQRGPYAVAARVVWRSEIGCGLRFASSVPVKQWIAYGSGSSGQQRVDAIIETVRHGSPGGADAAAPDPAAAASALAADQIETICGRIAEAVAELAARPENLAQDGEALQQLDIARQQLADLAAAIRRGG